MKAVIGFLLLTLVIGTTHAAKLEDVTILDLKYEKKSFEVKLQVKDAKKDSYFLIDIVKEDENAFDKLALVLKKLKKKDSFKLNLDIPSFSVSPPGSYYRSNSVTFIGSSEGESLINPLDNL